MLQTERAENFWFVPIFVNFEGTLAANEVKKLSNKCVWGKTTVWGPVLPPSYVPGNDYQFN